MIHPTCRASQGLGIAVLPNLCIDLITLALRARIRPRFEARFEARARVRAIGLGLHT